MGAPESLNRTYPIPDDTGRACPFPGGPPADGKTKRWSSTIKEASAGSAYGEGSTNGCDHGYDALRSLFADLHRASRRNDRLKGYRMEEGIVVPVHKRPRWVLPRMRKSTSVSPNASRPFTFKRVEALRPAVANASPTSTSTPFRPDRKHADLVEARSGDSPSW